MNLLVHHCDPESKYAGRVAYDSDSRTFYIEFKKGGVYRYFDVPDTHFFNVMATKTRFNDWREANPTLDPSDPPKDDQGAKLGSEGSYLIAHIVGKKDNRPYRYEPMDAVDAAEIFPYIPTEAKAVA